MAGKKRMIDDEQPSNDISAQLDVSFIELSQTTTAIKEDNVKDFNDDDIGMNMNKQVHFEDMNLVKVKLNMTNDSPHALYNSFKLQIHLHRILFINFILKLRLHLVANIYVFVMTTTYNNLFHGH